MAYTFKFVGHSTTSLSFTAYDLAEWTTLLPSEKVFPLPYLTAGLLRLHVIIFTLMTVYASVYVKPQLKLCLYLFALLLVVAQLPPLDFLNQLQDGNYQQQLIFALSSLILISFALFNDYTKYLEPILPIIGITSLLVTTHRLTQPMLDYRLSVSAGIGFYALLLLYSLYLAYTLYSLWKQKRDGRLPSRSNA